MDAVDKEEWPPSAITTPGRRARPSGSWEEGTEQRPDLVVVEGGAAGGGRSGRWRQLAPQRHGRQSVGKRRMILFRILASHLFSGGVRVMTQGMKMVAMMLKKMSLKERTCLQDPISLIWRWILHTHRVLLGDL